MLTNQSIENFLDELASTSPTPGGGSVAALAGAMGAALTSMVCNLTIGKKKYAEVENEMNDVRQRSEDLRRTFTALVDEDTQAFNNVMSAYALPKESDEQKAIRTAAIQSATKEAVLVPLKVMRRCIEGLGLAKTVAEKGNVNSVSDAGVSAIMLYGGLESAALNVQINLGSLQVYDLVEDTHFTESTNAKVQSLQREGFALLQTALAIVRGKMVQTK